MGTTNFDAVAAPSGFTGPLTGAVTATTAAATTSLTVGASGATIKGIFTGTVAVTIAADANAAEEDLDLTITGVRAGDVVCMAPINASMEQGVAVVAVWVSASDHVKVRISNLAGTGGSSALVGSGPLNWNYLWFDLT